MKAFRMYTDFAREHVIAIVFGSYGQRGPGGYVTYIADKVLYNNAPFHTDEDLLYIASDSVRKFKMLDKQGLVAQMFEMNSKYITKIGG